VKAGIDEFCQVHPETAHIYEMKQKAANVLKHALQEDEAWREFCRLAAQTRNQVQQTSLAPLAPPNQRTKARDMTVDRLMEWGARMLVFLDGHAPQADHTFDAKQVEAQFGWVVPFREPLRMWSALRTIVTVTEAWVRTQGLYRGCHLALQQRLDVRVQTERARMVRHKLLSFVLEESHTVHPNEHL
jgi:hypothetical protein